MKIKTAELRDAALRWAVAKADGRITTNAVIAIGRQLFENGDDGERVLYEPDNNWSQGGPIKERERIDILYDGNYVVARKARMVKHPTQNTMSYCAMRGHTELIAAMRCFVATKLGDEVEIPEELLK